VLKLLGIDNEVLLHGAQVPGMHVAQHIGQYADLDTLDVIEHGM
jgi:hypothetical protein